jgi:uncharacterized protein (TIGR03435 family)
MSPALRIAVGLVRTWTRIYTWRMPSGSGERRRAEIESDLWEFQRDAHDHASVALRIVLRFVAGLPDDVSWRIEQEVAAGSFTQESVVFSARLAGAVFFVGTLWVIDVDATRPRSALSLSDPATVASHEVEELFIPREEAVSRTAPTGLRRLHAGIAATVRASMLSPLSVQSPETPSGPSFEVASIKLNTSGETRARLEPQPGGRLTGTSVTAAMLNRFAYDLPSFHPAAQSAAGPRFEVASVKPSNPDAADPLGLPTPVPPTRGRLTILNAPLRFLVLRAYGPLFNFQIIGGPDWQMSRRFDIQAKAEDPAADMGAMLPMLKTLLEDRFQLKVHTETREMPIYALVVARDDGRLGANIRPSNADCSNPAQVPDTAALLQAGRGVPCAIMPAPTRVAGSMTLRANGASMASLARFLTGTTGRIVHDWTGLSGLYDWEMTYDRGVTPPPALQPGSNLPLSPPPSESPALTTALQEQLGLKLESTRGPVEVLVIDSAALPEPD